MEIAKVETLTKLDLDRMIALKNSSFSKAKFDNLKNQNSILINKEEVALSDKVSNQQKIAGLNLDKSQARAWHDGIIEEKSVEIGEFVSSELKCFS